MGVGHCSPGDELRGYLARTANPKGLAQLARAGDRDAISDLAVQLATSLSTAAVEASPCLEWLLQSLDQIAHGSSPDLAFGWTTGRGRRRSAKDLVQAWAVPARLRVMMEANPGMTRTLAIRLVGAEFCLSEKRVESLCARAGRNPQQMFDLLRVPTIESGGIHDGKCRRRIVALLQQHKDLLMSLYPICDGDNCWVVTRPVETESGEVFAAGAMLCVALHTAAANTEFVAEVSGTREFAKREGYEITAGDLLTWRPSAAMFVPPPFEPGDIVNCAYAEASAERESSSVVVQLTPKTGQVST